ncbi:MAG TPA: AMP-binding protein [Dongiaceae bacterium]|nr:AMP-binding protein [Dongiaceae bacterium]
MACDTVDTFPQLLLRHAKERGGRPAIREKRRGIWHTLTWRDLADEAEALACALSARGVQRGARVAVLGDNRPRLYTAICAAHWLGAIVVPLYQDAAAAELTLPLQSAEVTHVFAENQEQVDKLLEILPLCPSVRCIVYDKDRGMRHYQQPQLVSYAAFLAQGHALKGSRSDVLRAEAGRAAGQDAAFLFFTSGTTGEAKGVVATHAALIDRARVAAEIDGLTDVDVTIAYLPPGWIGQNVCGYVQPMVVGHCVCCPESSETLIADMREIGPTCFLATPRVLEALLTQVSMRLDDAGDFNRALYRRSIAVAQRVGARILARGAVSMLDRLAYLAYDLLIYGPLRDVLGLSKVRVAYAAGDALAPDLLMFFRSLGINLKQLYGSTETGFFVAMPRDGRVKPDTVGQAAEGVELKFTAEREILVRSPGLFAAYHRDAERTAEAKSADGWFNTGDIGYVDEDGHLRIVDRAVHVGALSDGTPYAPKVLENKLKFVPYIKEAVAFGHGRDMVCMLIDIDAAAVSRWADKRGITYTGHADLASRDEVYELIAGCIATVNRELALDPVLARCQLRRFSILHKELSADDGLLTRTGKLRRGAIAERYGELVDAMYAGHSDSAGVDGSPRRKIRDAQTVAPAGSRRAA